MKVKSFLYRALIIVTMLCLLYIQIKDFSTVMQLDTASKAIIITTSTLIDLFIIGLFVSTFKQKNN